jgi:hypothetical protein
MKKIASIILFSAFVCNAALSADNPFFGASQNQIMLNIGQGFDSGELIIWEHINKPAPFYMAQVSYSQPTTFFRMPARQSISGIKTQGFANGDYNNKCVFSGKCEWKNYSNEIFMLSEDVALLYNDRWYFGAGIGAAMAGKQTERENTKFLLGFKLFVGYRFAENWNAELFMQHFSNGDTGEENNVYDFLGFGAAYNF